MAPTNKALRTLLRPPPMKLLPRHCPDWRVRRRARKRGDPLSRPRRPIRGSDRQSSRPAQRVLSPAPCVAWRRSWLDVCRSCDAYVELRRRSSQRFGAGERPDRREVLSLRPAFAAASAWSPRRAITAASIRSVLARLPSAWAKARTCAGLTTTTGRPAPARPAATTASKPPVASIATIFGDKAPSRAMRSSPHTCALEDKTLAGWTNRHVQPIL